MSASLPSTEVSACESSSKVVLVVWSVSSLRPTSRREQFWIKFYHVVLIVLMFLMVLSCFSHRGSDAWRGCLGCLCRRCARQVSSNRYISAQCLWAMGATALLLVQVDPNVIHLIGRWHSDEMLRYLHIQAYPLIRDYSRCMLSARDYNLIPNHRIPQRWWAHPPNPSLMARH